MIFAHQAACPVFAATDARQAFRSAILVDEERSLPYQSSAKLFGEIF